MQGLAQEVTILRPELLEGVTPQDADTEMLARLIAHGYTHDTEAASDDGDWHQFNRRSLVALSEPALPVGFRFRTAADVGPAAATRQVHHYTGRHCGFCGSCGSYGKIIERV